MRYIFNKLKVEIVRDNFLCFLIGLNVGILITFFIIICTYFSSYADDIEITNIDVVYEVNDIEEEDVDVSDEDNIINIESDSEVNEQSDIIVSDNIKDNSEIVDNQVVDESISDDTPFMDDSIHSLPDVGGIIDRDDNGALYISEETPDLQSKIDLYEDLLSDEELKVFKEEAVGSEDLTDWDIADYFKNVVTQALFDIFGEPDNENTEEDEDIEILQASDERLITMGVLESPFLAPLRSNNRNGYKNVVVFHGTFNNYDCDLIIPYDQYKNLLVQSGYIVNIGNQSITGKILYDDEPLNPADYNSYTYILNPIYGNTSNVYQYGSFNYRRYYYLTTTGSYDRITYQDMYGNFFVDDIDVYYSNSERVYYICLFILLFMGVNFLWNRRH